VCTAGGASNRRKITNNDPRDIYFLGVTNLKFIFKNEKNSNRIYTFEVKPL